MTESFCLYKLVEITKLINKFSCESNHKKKKKKKKKQNSNSFSSSNQT